MSTTSYTGTYMTSWQLSDGTYTVGPVIVVDSETSSLTVDGVAIANPTFTGAVVVWTSSGNPSSGVLSFYTNNGVNGFTGTYVEGSGPLPSGTNLYGTSATPSQALSTWNATYTTYNVSGGNSTKDGTLVIADPSVTYNQESVKNTIYTGESTTSGEPIEQLAWFTTGGNSENVVIQFSSTESQGYLTFYGTKWTSGTQPSEVNFTGTTASTPPPPTQIVVALIAVISSNAQQNTTTEVEVSVEVSVDVAVDVAVIDVAAEVGDAPAPGSYKAGDYDEDGRAADDLAEKAKLLVSRTKYLD
ncbi:MAG TPA: hypothetical protein VM555_06695 [Tahibacter sp.]|jgi:hypothetical protein|nr:hypothetical protein [Tahibacter sp.]